MRTFCFTGIKDRQSLYNLWNRCYTAYRPIKTKVKKFARFDGENERIREMKKQLLHSGWQLTTVGKNDTIPATVPGSVYNDLLNAGRMEDPYWRDIMLCGGTAAASSAHT